MFKKLINKLEEVKQVPLLGLSPGPSPQKDHHKSAENAAPLIDLSVNSEPSVSSQGNNSSLDSSQHSSETQVPILNLEASSPSSTISNLSLEKNIVFSPFTNVSPQEETPSRRSSLSSMTSESPLFPSLNLSMRHYNLISDLESEAEEPPIVNLDAYSKEDIYLSFRKVERRLSKYRNKYTELVAAYRDNEKEKEKIKAVLMQTQDKALRRITELREQSQLELKAKQHLEENFRMSLEEKDELIGVLKTKIQLLKENGSESDNLNSSLSKEDSNSDVSYFKEKNKRLEVLLSKCKETIKNNKERSVQLHSENEQLKKELELTKIESSKDSSSDRIKDLQEELENVKQQLQTLDQDGAMALAETKKQMHEELEQKERIVKELGENLIALRKEKEELEHNVNSLNSKLQQSEEQRTVAIEEMQLQLKKAETVLEEEKSNLVQELSRGKAATILLLQQETEKRLSEISHSHEESLAKKDLESNERISTLLSEFDVQLENKKHEYEAALRSKELELSQQMAEKENQMMLAIEERELQKMASVAALDTKKDELQLTIDNLMLKQTELEETIEEMKSSHSNEIKNWIVQIEDNSKRHKAKIEELINEHKNQCEKLKSEHEMELDIKETSLKQEFELHVEHINNLHHEEMSTNSEEHQKLLTVKIENMQLNYETQIEELNKKFEQSVITANMDVASNFDMQLDSLHNEHQKILDEKINQIDEYKSTIKELFLENENLKITICKIESVKLELENILKEKESLIIKIDELQLELEKSRIDRKAIDSEYKIVQQEIDRLNYIINEKDVEIKNITAQFELTISNKDELYAQELKQILVDVEKQQNEKGHDFNLKLAGAIELRSVYKKNIQEFQHRETELNLLLEQSQLKCENITAELLTIKVQYENDKQKLTEEVNSKSIKLDNLTHEISVLQQNCNDLQNQILEKDNVIFELQVENKRSGGEFSKQQQEIKDLHIEEKEKMQCIMDVLNNKLEELNKNFLQSEDQHKETEKKWKKEVENNEKLKQKFEEKRKKVKENIEKIKQSFHSKLVEKDEELKKKLEELENLKEIYGRETKKVNEKWEMKAEKDSSDHESRIIEITLEFETKWKDSIELHQKEMVALKNVNHDLETKLKASDHLMSLIEERENQIRALQQELDMKINEYDLLEQKSNSLSIKLEQIHNENNDHIKQIELFKKSLNEKDDEILLAHTELQKKEEKLQSLKIALDNLQQNKTEEWLVQIERLNEMCHQFEESAILVENKYEVEKNERQILEKESKYLKDELNLSEKNLKESKEEIINLNSKLELLESLQEEIEKLQNLLAQQEQQIGDLTLEKSHLLQEKSFIEEKMVNAEDNKCQLENLQEYNDKYKAEMSILKNEFENLKIENKNLELCMKQIEVQWEEKLNSVVSDYERKMDYQKMSFEEQLSFLKQQNLMLQEHGRITSNELVVNLQEQLEHSQNKLLQTFDFNKKELENINAEWKLKMQQQKELLEKAEADKIKEYEAIVQSLETKCQKELIINQELNKKNDDLDKIIEMHKKNTDELDKATSHLEEALSQSKITNKITIYNDNEVDMKKKEIDQVQQSAILNDEEINSLKKRMSIIDQDLRNAIEANTIYYEEQLANCQKQIHENSIQFQVMQSLIEEKQKENSILLKDKQDLEQKQTFKLGELKKKAEMKLGQIKKQLQDEKEQCLLEYHETANRLQSQLSFQETIHSSQIADLQQKLESQWKKHQSELEVLEKQQNVHIDQVVREEDEINQRTLEDLRLQFELLEKENSTLKQVLEEKVEASKEKTEVSNELTKESEILKKEYELKIETMEKEHNSKIKKLVRELTSEMAQKEKEAQEAYQEVIENNIHTEERMNHEHRQELTELHQELAEKNMRIEELLEQQDERFKEKEAESRTKLKEYENKISFLETQQIQTIEEHQKELTNLEQRLKSAVRTKLQEKDVLHQNEIEEMIKEWERERKHVSKHTTLSPHLESQELLTQSNLALNAIDSGRESSELLRKQIMSYTREIEGLKTRHRLEIAELKHHLERIHNGLPCPLLEDSDINNFEKSYQTQNSEFSVESLQDIVQKLGTDSWENKSSLINYPTGPLLTESTEMEYLKNILYEYMMGRETLTMAKVIAAVMKFPEDRTRKIIEKEEARITKWLPA